VIKTNKRGNKMVEKSKSKKKSEETKKGKSLCCSLPKVKERDLSHILDGHRLSLISIMSKMWVNGTNLTYYFFKEPAQ
jgi:hypothetical protein